MATNTTRKSRAQRAAEQAEQDAIAAAEAVAETEDGDTAETEDQDKETHPEQAAEPEPKLPVVSGDLGKGRITYYWPSITLPDGTHVDCSHGTWGHGKESAAAKCLRALAAEHGVRVEIPE